MMNVSNSMMRTVLFSLNIMVALAYVNVPNNGRPALLVSIGGRNSNNFINSHHSILAAKKDDTDPDFLAFADSLDDDEDDQFKDTAAAAAADYSTASATAVEEPPVEEAADDDDNSSKPWQASLDELLDPTTSVAQRQILLSKLVGANEEIRSDVLTALRDRKIDPILTPTGKKLQDGSRAVARQLASDILPSIAKTAQSIPNAAATAATEGTTSSNGSASPTSLFPVPPSPQDISKVGSRIVNAISNQVQSNLKNLQEDLQNPVENIPKRITSQTEALVTETRNVFSETPVGLKEPPYTVISQTDDYEIREYEAYDVATTPMGRVGEKVNLNMDVAATGAAFNTLAAYIFGANEQGSTMEMTTPVTTTSWGEMRFYVTPDGVSDTAGTIPTPLTDDTTKYETGSVEIRTIPPSRLAVRRFTGFVTEGEVSRQKESLLAALYLDGIELDVPHGDPITHVVFQYNPPYTIPIVRRNEIAVPVRKEGEEPSLQSEWTGTVTSSSSSTKESQNIKSSDDDEGVDEHFGADDLSPSDY